MTPELGSLILALLFGMGGAVIHAAPTLENLRKAIRASGLSEKQAAPTGMDTSRWSRLLNGVGKDRLHLELVAQLPAPVLRYLYLFELIRVGLPMEIEQSQDIARVVKQLRRSA